MTVGEAIKLLQQEDPNAELICIPRHMRFDTVNSILYYNKHFWRFIACDGKDTTTHTPYVVLITERSDE